MSTKAWSRHVWRCVIEETKMCNKWLSAEDPMLNCFFTSNGYLLFFFFGYLELYSDRLISRRMGYQICVKKRWICFRNAVASCIKGKCKSYGVFHLYSLQNMRNYIVGKVNRVGWGRPLGFLNSFSKINVSLRWYKTNLPLAGSFFSRTRTGFLLLIPMFSPMVQVFWDVYFINAIFTRYSSFFGHYSWSFWKDDSFSLALLIVIKRFPWMEIGYALSKSTYPKWKI